MNEELQKRINDLENQIADILYILRRKTGLGPNDIKGNIVSGTGSIGIIPSDTITAAMLQSNSVSNAKMQNDSIKQAELDYEVVTLAFASGDTSQTATVTSGSVIVGVYESVVTSTPAQGELQLAISGTTLTGTRSASPGGAAAITYTVVLLKV